MSFDVVDSTEQRRRDPFASLQRSTENPPAGNSPAVAYGHFPQTRSGNIYIDFTGFHSWEDLREKARLYVDVVAVLSLARVTAHGNPRRAFAV